MMKKFSSMTLQLGLLALSLIVLGLSFYLQFVKGFEPCPLCLMQRICIILIIMFGAINLYRISYKQPSLMIMQTLWSVLGLYFASRQLWLLSLPSDQVPACMPGLTILIHYFPWQETARALFWGSGNCTEINWSWLGLSLPTWSALYFIASGSTSGLIYYRERQRLTSSK
jgi:disulfide bond formation protein DsbB